MENAPSITVWEELMDFLASAPTTEQLLAYQPSHKLKDRLHDLLQRNQQNRLGAEEWEELQEFLRLDRFVSMLKRRARKNMRGK